MKVSTSGFYSWLANPVSDKEMADALLTNAISDIHAMSRRSYGSPRVHAKLRLGQGTNCSRKRVERLMREAHISAIYRRKNKGCTRRDPGAEPADDLVGRCFDPTAPDRRRLHGAGLLGSMGSVGDCFDSVAESFFGTLQLELLDEHRWESRQQLASAVFDWIEAWYNPRRRHSYCKILSPVDYENTMKMAETAA